MGKLTHSARFDCRKPQKKNQTVVRFGGQLTGSLTGNSLKIMSHTPGAGLATGFGGTERLSPNFAGKLPKAMPFTKRPSF